MGKISDALEKHKKENPLGNKPVSLKTIERLIPDSQEVIGAKEIVGGSRFSNKLVAINSPNSIEAEKFKRLRAEVLFARDRKRPRIIMVTSAFANEGKTYVSSNLAASIALGIEEYVLLIDCDLRRPNIHNLMGYTNNEGLHEYLIGKRFLSELIIRTKLPKLSVLLAGSNPPNPTEILSSSKMENFLEEVKTRYNDRFIIIDTTPCQATAETNILAKFVDAIIFVVMSQKTPMAAIKNSIQKLEKEKILGIVFNGYQLIHGEYGSYYKDYYNMS